MFEKYISPLGYQTDEDGIDSYGVNHKDFSLRDELEYQNARVNREHDLIAQYNNQGITKDYPQQATNFWGTNADNNYGFGKSDIGSNIENVMVQRTENTVQQPPVRLHPQYWENSTDGKRVYEDVLKNEGTFIPQPQNIFDYTKSALKGGMNLVTNFFPIKKANLTDKYKHAFMNCKPSQHGQGGADIAKLISNLREWNDVRTGANTIDSSQGDNYANKIGRFLGGKYPSEDCDKLIQRYIKKKY